MKYTPGGYSWLSVTPESPYEKEIEKIEEEIHLLKKQYEKNQEKTLLDQIRNLEELIQQKKRD